MGLARTEADKKSTRFLHDMKSFRSSAQMYKVVIKAGSQANHQFSDLSQFINPESPEGREDWVGFLEEKLLYSVRINTLNHSTRLTQRP
jgi:hypothetical protein